MAKRRYPPPAPAVPRDITDSNPDVHYGALKNCAICDFTYHESDLVEQRGHLVCPRCLDHEGHQGVVLS